jgi:gluconokinase
VTRIVVTGVAASGKTTVGRAIADELDLEFLDADAAHPPENIEKMSSGIPLTDDDRVPWLERLGQALAASDGIVITCSALKRAYRDVLRSSADDVQFVFLDVPQHEVERRIRRRRNHFMKVRMVASQFEALERPGVDETDVVTVDADADHETTRQRVLDAVRSSD